MEQANALLLEALTKRLRIVSRSMPTSKAAASAEATPAERWRSSAENAQLER